jgi:beta-lactamase class A
VPDDAPATTVAADATAVGQRTAAILDMVNSEQPVSKSAARALTDPAYAEELGSLGLAGQLEQLRLSAPFEVVDYAAAESQSVTTLKSARGILLTLTLGLDGAGLVNAMDVAAETPEIAQLADAQAAFDALGLDYSALVAKVDDGTCSPVLAVREDLTMPVASLFKLYVLGAVSDAVTAGQLAWDEELTITEELKSLPAGELQDLPAGSKVTVREAVQKMASISDNTAADLLIHRLGRERVEQQVAIMGHHDPALLSPFPTTRELFQLSFGTPEEREAWLNGDAAARRQILAGLADQPLNRDPVAATHRIGYPYGLDWFASVSDICAAHASLQHKQTPVADFLTGSPRIPLDSAVWPYVGYKGGSMPGVLAASMLLRNSAGAAWFVGVQQSAAGAIGLPETLYTMDVIKKTVAAIAASENHAAAAAEGAAGQPGQ